MLNFRDGQRIIVVNPEPEHEALRGKTGTVHRRKISGRDAWCKMDEDLPKELAHFEAGDSRHNNVCLWPDECELAPEESTS
jgi:hypothetical protein